MKLKVIHLPTSVGGNPQMISDCMRSLGINSQSWVLSNHTLGLGFNADKFIYKNSDRFWIKEMKRLLALRYVFIFNFVFFNFGSTLYTPFPKYRFAHQKNFKYLFLLIYSKYRKIMQTLEISILKFRKFKIFVQYQGSDARQHEYTRKNFSIRIPQSIYGSHKKLTEIDELKKQQIKIFEQMSSQIYSLNPDLMHVLPKRTKFLPYSHIDLEKWKPVYLKNNNRPIRIGHAPSNREVKGTKQICDAIEELKKKGNKFEFILVEGVNYNNVKMIYENIDILIDQLFVGWYGGLAVELMALGKPVLAYLRDEDFKFISQEMAHDIPVINVNHCTLAEKLEMLISSPKSSIQKIGYKSRKYVEKWHNPKHITNLIVDDINSTFNSLNRKI
jgi:hypothetical protein